jgi:hypothetical protein
VLVSEAPSHFVLRTDRGVSHFGHHLRVINTPASQVKDLRFETIQNTDYSGGSLCLSSEL